MASIDNYRSYFNSAYTNGVDTKFVNNVGTNIRFTLTTVHLVNDSNNTVNVDVILKNNDTNPVKLYSFVTLDPNGAFTFPFSVMLETLDSLSFNADAAGLKIYVCGSIENTA